jgi:hypothetical protein
VIKPPTIGVSAYKYKGGGGAANYRVPSTVDQHNSKHKALKAQMGCRMTLCRDIRKLRYLEDEQGEARSGPPRHADEHGEPSIDVPEPRPVGRRLEAGGGSPADSQDEAWTRPPRYADEHE